MTKSLFKAFLPLLALLAIPVLMRPAAEQRPQGGDRVIILTPHNEAIRSEFSIAFSRHYKEQTGRNVELEWRTPGGTCVRLTWPRSHPNSTPAA